ncbi:NAD(P)-dependent oxidoreductase [Desulfosarcina alkanivorans]|uniref:NAD(P)-dependent oxidoreductase n=1 Tax=Desulfosarcina alkanivorans TaxID=571177 RepID=A0A5K7YUZ3_9BACT|nr:SDR family oxidoreductase [Desulfosarcina alkanivorans]BBO68507.1 NAD(P)-dependent oxidoreductase [Desulfosarcina alkanivorans]
MKPSTPPILVTGGTGYVGGRLIPRLLAGGHRVRAMARSPERLRCRPWGSHERLEIVPGDALDCDAFVSAASGCGTAYYLIHSMNAHKGRFADADRTAARHMVAAARDNRLSRIIYLGGLGEAGHEGLSRHLKSRHEVERILRAGPVPVTILRAAMILGSGSASFEMLRYLVDRLPVMITPRWVRTPCQPIAIGNVLDYLQGCLAAPETVGGTFDIGGPDILSYRDLIQIYAREAGLRRRLIIPVPVLTPWLSARWVHLVTPVPAAIAQPLAEGLSIPVVCRDHRIRELVPVAVMDTRQTVRTALERIRQEEVDTCWFDGGGSLPPEWTTCGDADYAGGTVLGGAHRIVLEGDTQRVWSTVQAIGGANGWYFAQGLWWLRGVMDRLVGGPGLRRGRRHPESLRVGDGLDFWRVVALDPPHRLLLLAEMKTPGDALLEFVIAPQGPGRVELKMISRFLPRGLAGILYWYVLLPTHRWLFEGMLRAVASKTGLAVHSGPETAGMSSAPECRL